jgi:alginate O-acetyltransferase complex protein AlgI
MELSSLFFLFQFLPLFILLYFLLKKQVHNIFLLVASIFFYAWGEGQYLLVLLFSILGNYFLGLAIDKSANPRSKKFIFIAAVIFNIGILAYFKYTLFILRELGIAGSMSPIHLPVGISFFTFQAISYLVDIYRKTVPNDKNPVNFGLYMALFPKLTSGPIISYHKLAPQILRREANFDEFSLGVKRFILGLGKKILIANTLGKTCDAIFSIPAVQLTAGLSWLGIICFALQIYFDFSGYSDMAIGLGRLIGFKFPENFNYPYISKTIKEFWTRWHISLAQWLRDYLFLPIAYSLLRKIKNDTVLRVKAEDWAYYISVFSTFLICGVWHGANWTFLIWGSFFGILLILEHVGLRKFLKHKWAGLGLLYCQFMVVIAWVFFRSESLGYACHYLKSMFGFGMGDGLKYNVAGFLNVEVIFFLILGIVGSIPICPRLRTWTQRLGIRYGFLNPTFRLLQTGYLLMVFLISTMAMASGTFNPFIYFRF